MAMTITIPDGYNVQMMPNGQFQIVLNQQQNNIPQVAEEEYPQEYSEQMVYEEDTNDYFDDVESKDSFFRQFNNINKYRQKKIELTRAERELLEFCHRTDMKKFLKENVQDKPFIVDDNGNWSKGWQD